jgi:hypothetical protein
MGTFEKLQHASFRGVPFLISNEQVIEGPKSIIHDFIGTNFRYIEQMGSYPPEFTLTCIIHGENSLLLRDEFAQALSKPGFGELIHPIYGILNVKVTDKFTVNSTDSRVGEHIFVVTFGESGLADLFSPKILPSDSAISNNVVEDTQNLSNIVEKEYVVPERTINWISVKDQVLSIVENFARIIDTVGEPIENALALFNNTVTKLEDNIYSVISSATNLVLNLNNLYFDFRSVVDNPSKLLDQYFLLIDYAISVINRNTALRIERSNNEILLRDHLNLTLISFIIEGAVYREYNTDTELNEMSKKVSDLYNSFLKTDLDPNDDVFRLQEDSNVRKDFSSLYDLFVRNFIEKEQSIYKVKELPKIKNSTFLLSYKYFGNVTYANIINQLNPGVNHCGFNTKILSITK